MLPGAGGAAHPVAAGVAREAGVTRSRWCWDSCCDQAGGPGSPAEGPGGAEHGAGCVHRVHRVHHLSLSAQQSHPCPSVRLCFALGAFV